jgi:hypothetical protein
VIATDYQTVRGSAQQLKQLQEAVQPFELGSAVLEPELDVFVLQLRELAPEELRECF